jgi:hypothetical protein
MAVSDFRESFPKVSSNHCFSDSNNGLLRVLRTSRRSSGGRPRISFSMAYNPAMRSRASAAVGDLIKAGVTICLQCASKVAQVGSRMFALTIR